MGLSSDAMMVLFYDIEGDTNDHDDWHSYEHFHERLSVPGFLRATRWIATDGAPRYLVTYEVSDVNVGTSDAYLERLNNPTPWTSDIMPRFRGMIRGFCNVVASCGFGFGQSAVAIRFTPEEGAEKTLSDWIAKTLLPDLASRRGMVGAYLMRPVPPPPMTREQALRGPDKAMSWLVIATAYDAAVLKQTADEVLTESAFSDHGASPDLTKGFYQLHHTATADEAARTPKPQDMTPELRKNPGAGRTG